MKTVKTTTSKLAATASTAMTTIATPLGPMTLAATARGLCGAWFEGQRHYPDTAGWAQGDSVFFESARAQLAAYFAGERVGFDLSCGVQGCRGHGGGGYGGGSQSSDSQGGDRQRGGRLGLAGIVLDLSAGTAFQQAVWQALLRIPTGLSTSYGGIAQQLNNPKAVRAVGAAVGRNPVSIIVPCHRVLGADGSLTGYAGGLDRKIALLRLEGVAHTAHATARNSAHNTTPNLTPNAPRQPVQSQLL